VSSAGRVDRTALKVNQFFIVTLLVLAFVVGATPAGLALVVFVMAVMALGTAFPRAGLFKAAYTYALQPAGLLKPRIVAEDPVQHLFAQGMGAAVLVAAAILLAAGASIAGWALVWVVVVLALVNLVFNFCTGCFIYTQLDLHRVFVHAREPRSA
jgi:hypothetical protein